MSTRFTPDPYQTKEKRHPTNTKTQTHINPKPQHFELNKQLPNNFKLTSFWLTYQKPIEWFEEEAKLREKFPVDLRGWRLSKLHKHTLIITLHEALTWGEIKHFVREAYTPCL